MGCGFGKGCGGEDGTNKGSPEAKAAWAAQSAVIDAGGHRNDNGDYVTAGGQTLTPTQVNQGAAKRGKG